VTAVPGGTFLDHNPGPSPQGHQLGMLHVLEQDLDKDEKELTFGQGVLGGPRTGSDA
jgi:hypothetical protein